MISAAARIAIALSLAATAPVARACSVCSRGNPLAPAAEGHGRGGDLRIALDAEYLSTRTGTPNAPAGFPMHDDLDQYTLKLTGVYSPTSELNLVASVPFTRKKMAMEHAPGLRFVASDRNGVGDVEVGARWFFWERTNMRTRMRHGLALSAGTSLPTGPNDPRDFVPGLPNPQHEQVGTGAFGPYGGLSYRLQKDAFAGLLSVTGRVHNANSQGYRFGSALLFTVQGQWTPVHWLALGLGLDGHDGGRDRQAGAWIPNTGGLVLWASPSVFLNVYRGFWVTLRSQLPFYTDLVGDQTVRPVLLGGVQYDVF